MRRRFLPLALLAAAAPAAADDRADLLAIEAESHDQWLRGDTAALAELMAEEYRFVVMNGAVERRDQLVAHLVEAADPVVVAAEEANRYGFDDIDGKRPKPLDLQRA